MNCPAMPPGGGRGMRFRKPFRPKTRKITPARYRAIAETVLITRFSFSVGTHYQGAYHIDVNIVDDVYFGKIQESYSSRYSGDVAGLARHVKGDARSAGGAIEARFVTLSWRAEHPLLCFSRPRSRLRDPTSTVNPCAAAQFERRGSLTQ